MKKISFLKRASAFAAAFCVAACAISGCGGGSISKGTAKSSDSSKTADASETADSGQAMGRYLEEDVPLPDGCSQVVAIRALSDDSLAIVYSDDSSQYIFAKSTDQGQTWGDSTALIDLLGLSDAAVSSPVAASIGPDGSIFASYFPADQANSSELMSGIRYFYNLPDAGAKELDCSANLKNGSFFFSNAIDEDGNVFISESGNGILEYRLSDGSLVRRYEEGNSVAFFGVSQGILCAVTDGTVHYYSTGDGKPLEGGDALTAQVTSDSSNLEQNISSCVPILFLGAEKENTVYYLDHTGLYRYTFGGTMLEQIIDASLNSLGSPSTYFTAATRDDTGNFYVASGDAGSGAKLCRYRYSPDVAAVPTTELTVYSLSDNSFLRQAAAVFQKENPDIYLNLETGTTGSDGITATDALKTLNTEIMAGKGPDILLLDGIPTDTYIEKGLLEDLSGILGESGLLENIKAAYTEDDGSIYVMPVQFGIPMLTGNSAEIASVTDLGTLADLAEQHASEYQASQTSYFVPANFSLSPKMLLESLSMVSSPAWFADGKTLDSDAVKEFLTQANRIWQAGAQAVDSFFSQSGIDGTYFDTTDYEYAYPNLYGNEMTDLNFYVFCAGGIYNTTSLLNVISCSVTNADGTPLEKDLDAVSWNGQAKDVFLPANLVGISAKSTQKNAAESFVSFLFSDEGQRVSSTAGFPATESAYDSFWDLGEEGTTVDAYSTSSSADPSDSIDVTTTVPAADVLVRYKALGKSLTTPALGSQVVEDAVKDSGSRYLKGEISLDEAVNAILQEVNLYLAE